MFRVGRASPRPPLSNTPRIFAAKERKERRDSKPIGHEKPSAAQPQPKKEHDQNNSDNLFLHYFVLNYFDLNRPCLDLLEEGPKEKDVQKKQEVDG